MACGIAHGSAVVGTVTVGTGGQRVVVGRLLERAHALERLCGCYGVPCLTTSLEAPELATLCTLQWVDVTRVASLQAGAVGLVAPMGLKEGDRMDEWMYELEDAADVYGPIQEAFAGLLKKKDVSRQLDRMSAEVKALPGAVRLQHIVQTHGTDTETYLASQEELHRPFF